MNSKTTTFQIGNSDDKLTKAQWSLFMELLGFYYKRQPVNKREVSDG